MVIGNYFYLWRPHYNMRLWQNCEEIRENLKKLGQCLQVLGNCNYSFVWPPFSNLACFLNKPLFWDFLYLVLFLAFPKFAKVGWHSPLSSHMIKWLEPNTAYLKFSFFLLHMPAAVTWYGINCWKAVEQWLYILCFNKFLGISNILELFSHDWWGVWNCRRQHHSQPTCMRHWLIMVSFSCERGLFWNFP